jgi:hypothetical protein
MLRLAHKAELVRVSDTPSLEEQQLLDATHDRLLTWKEPHKRRGNTMTDDNTATPAADDAAAEQSKPEVKKAKRTATAKTSVKKESTVMAKKTKTAKAKKAPAKAKKATGNGAVERIAADAKIVAVKGVENPFREGSGAHERTELVIKNSGKTREAIEKLKGIMSSTVPNLVKAGVVRVG